ncbi:MAG TPA: glycosyl hydrolase 115 family protein, partial [Verrucomicrobiae bacterium]
MNKISFSNVLLKSLPLFLCLATPHDCLALGQTQYVETTSSPGSFPVCAANAPAVISVDTNDFAGIVRAANDLRADVFRVTGRTPQIVSAGGTSGANDILIGTIGKSDLIDRLVREKKIDVAPIAGKWESFFVQVVPNPFPGVESALVICGSDKRGTIYGIYDLSEQIGVSPWHYWADVPATHHDQLFVKAGKFVQGPPSVKYRGIFLNDEAPDLSNWIHEKYGNAPGLPGVANYGRGFYTNLFELMLRIRANYLWPAMWNNSFNEDDTNNPALADEYGIVMGTSHQEPMMRAQKEWDRKYSREYGSWNYARIPNVVSSFWRDGIERNKNYENLTTIGLRGANDTPMAEGGPEANRALLEKIVVDQRKILGEVVNPDVTKVPQVWCLYKEVMDYYTAGMRVPDDVTLLWAEDNWGNVRRLPTAEERQRSGGAGIYYHFDYHGGPRSYQWINTDPIPKIWDQMSLAKQYGADRVWIVNVGHFKGYELPTEFFMSLAWDASRWNGGNLGEFTRRWATREFGPT